MSFLRRVSENSGETFAVIASALQKAIRRNKVSEALYWANEYLLSGFPNALLIRLWVIASEDIGYAHPYVVACMNPNGRSPEELLSTTRMLAECSPKSRGLCNLSVVISSKMHLVWAPSILSRDWGSLLESIRGASEFEECCELVYLGLVWIEARQKERKVGVSELRRLKEEIYQAICSGREAGDYGEKARENLLKRIRIVPASRVCNLWLFHAAWISFQGVSADAVLRMIALKKEKHLYRVPSEKPPMHEYIYDKHTAEGKAKKRGIRHFFTVGAKLACPLSNEPYRWRAQAFYESLEKAGSIKPKSAYLREHFVSRFLEGRGKREKPEEEEPVAKRQKSTHLRKHFVSRFLGGRGERENPEEEEPAAKRQKSTAANSSSSSSSSSGSSGSGGPETVLAQLQCGGKPPVYFVRRGEISVVIKGPIDAISAANCDFRERWKSRLKGIHPTGGRIEGFNGKLFWVAPNLFGDGKVPVKTHRGVLVANYDASPWKRVTDESVLVELILALIFRHSLSVSDTVSRNLILARGRVYSIDESGSGALRVSPGSIQLMSKPFPADVRKKLERVAAKHWESIYATLWDWRRNGFDKVPDALMASKGRGLQF